MKTVDTPLLGVSVSNTSNSNLLTSASRCSLLLLTRPPWDPCSLLMPPSPRLSPITTPVSEEAEWALRTSSSSSKSNLVSAVSLLLSVVLGE